MSAEAPVLDRLSTLADPTRSRILLALERNELTVGELCAVLQLPQSTVSRHLRWLSDEGWVVSRQEGTSRFYSLAALDPAAQQLWSLVAADLRESVRAQHDRARVESVLAERRAKSREYFSTAAEQWDTVRRELVGERADVAALLGLLDDRWVAGDLGCGTGHLAATLAPHVARVIAVDASDAMLAAARERLAGVVNVELRSGELESLPVDSNQLDVSVLSLVLHYAADPLRVLTEAHRVLRPGGRLLVVDMLPHERAEYRQQMGHVWLGFSEEQISRWLAESGFEAIRVRRLPPDPAAKGPLLFAATARKVAAGRADDGGPRRADPGDRATARARS
ncbi:MAG TPA: metalloregulator ArsR/SmtB family transcription factor [Gemmatimonadaceae bacterium]